MVQEILKFKEVKAYISINLHLSRNENKLYKPLEYWSKDMLNFDFLEKILELVSPHILWMIFQWKYLSCFFLLAEVALKISWD